ncbi:MAG: LuxR C-terminal-related transcriptional regulator [Candidatus Contendobacter sp.]|nr:response regulator transcription factor [Gammaproteobacteria bacterium]MCC8992903.1 LuxR C-terminal-related transcriptional regulator [Candidatus Contendobacter sp.]
MNTAESPLIYIVDDDAALCSALRGLLGTVGLDVRAFADLDPFLEAYQADQPGCLLLNDAMPGHGGLSAQRRLSELGMEVPVIIMADHSDVATAVVAMKQGALDFVVKPFNEQLLLDGVHQAIAEDRVRQRNRAWRADLQRRFDTLTPREQDVLRWITEGLSNQEIAEALQLSCKTVEVHRAKVMHKMQAHVLSQLIRMAMTLETA